MPESQTTQQMPAIWHIEMTHGDSLRISILVLDDEDPPSPIDLTGYTITATVHPFGGGDDVEIDKLGTSVLADGELDFELTPANSAALPINSNPWCVVFVDPSGFKRTYISGLIIMKGCE